MLPSGWLGNASAPYRVQFTVFQWFQTSNSRRFCIYQEVLLVAMANELSNILIRFSEAISSMFGAGMTTTKSRRPYHRHSACARLGNVFSHDIKSCQMIGRAALTHIKHKWIWDMTTWAVNSGTLHHLHCYSSNMQILFIVAFYLHTRRHWEKLNIRKAWKKFLHHHGHNRHITFSYFEEIINKWYHQIVWKKSHAWHNHYTSRDCCTADNACNASHVSAETCHTISASVDTIHSAQSNFLTTLWPDLHLPSTEEFLTLISKRHDFV